MPKPSISANSCADATPRTAGTAFEDLLRALRNEHECVLKQFEYLKRENLLMRSCWMGQHEDLSELDPDSWHTQLPKEDNLRQVAAHEARTCTTPRTPEQRTPRVGHAEKNEPVAAPQSPPESVGQASIQTLGAASIQSMIAESIATRQSDVGLASYDHLQGWQRHLIEIFAELDADGSGSLSTDELREAVLAAGIPQARMQKVLKEADVDRSGEIELSEWIKAVSSSRDSEIVQMTENLQKNRESLGRALPHMDVKKSTPRCMLMPYSPFRVSYDLLLGVACMYSSLVLPFAVAWQDSMDQNLFNMFEVIERCITGIFLVDIILNFRTAYHSSTGDLVLDPWYVTRHYLRTWFVLDTLSSFPFEDLTDSVNLQVLKILKLSRLLKIIKMAKVRFLVLDEMSDFLDDIAHSKMGEVLTRRYSVFLQMLLVCHWLACGMKIVDEGFLVSNGGMWSEYLASLYWSMTTLTTVGYGDMIPITDAERAYTLLAMVVGGAFYGYVIGATTSLVSNSDLNKSAYYDRMALVRAWINHHRLPRRMARTLRHFFQACMHERAALNEADIWHDLSPELQREVGQYVIHEHVRNNPLFDKMSMSAVVQLQSVLRKFTTTAGSVVASKGEVGTAMYIVDSGALEMSRDDGAVAKLGPGQSFGEEVLLGFTEEYSYTVVVVEEVHLEMILESEFLTAFETLPNQLRRMRQNALELNPQWEQARETGFNSQGSSRFFA